MIDDDVLIVDDLDDLDLVRASKPQPPKAKSTDLLVERAKAKREKQGKPAAKATAECQICRGHRAHTKHQAECAKCQRGLKRKDKKLCTLGAVFADVLPAWPESECPRCGGSGFVVPTNVVKKKITAPVPKGRQKRRGVSKRKGAASVGSKSRVTSSLEPGGGRSAKARRATAAQILEPLGRKPDPGATGGDPPHGRGTDRGSVPGGSVPRPPVSVPRPPDPDRAAAPAPADEPGAGPDRGPVHVEGIGTVYGDVPLGKDGKALRAGKDYPASPEHPGLISGTCWIPWESLPLGKKKRIKRDLTIFNRKKDTELVLFRDHDMAIELPRAYAVKEFGELFFGADGMAWGSDVDLSFHGTLREDKGQERIVGEILAAIRPGHGGVAQAPCGTGKTVMGLYCAVKWGKTTAVLVHTEFLADQWEESAIKFLHLKPEEIGRVQGPQCDYKGKKLVLIMVESIAAKAQGKGKDYPASFYDWAGTLLLDEVHRHAADTWHLAVGKFNAAYRLGLSATPHRTDDMEQVVFDHVGQIVSRTEDYEVHPEVYIIEHESNLNPKSYDTWRGGKPTGQVNMAKLVNKLTKDTDRNGKIASQIAQALDASRKVLMLSERLAQLDALLDLTHLMLTKTGKKLDKYVGGMDKDARDVSSTADGIFATYHLAAEGLDIPDLDTLVMASPRSNIEQSVGRILRVHDEKKIPIVIDVVDVDIGVCCRMAEKRENTYHWHGWTVTEVELGE